MFRGFHAFNQSIDSQSNEICCCIEICWILKELKVASNFGPNENYEI